MGRNWIKIETVTMDKPEVCVMATQLRLDPDAVVGKLVRLWSWAEVSRINPKAMSITPEFVDKLVGKKGFGVALMKAGWLKEVDGVMQFPNFGRHNGPEGKGRALTAVRVSRHRQKKRDGNDNKDFSDDGSIKGDLSGSVNATPKVRAINQKRNTVKELLKNDLSKENTPIGGIHSGAILPDDIELESPFDDVGSDKVTISYESYEVHETDESSPFEEQSPFDDSPEFGGSSIEKTGTISADVVSIASPPEVAIAKDSGGEQMQGAASEAVEVDQAPKAKKTRGGKKSNAVDDSDQPMLF